MSDQQDSSSTTGSSVNVQQLKSQLVNKFQAHRPLVLKLHSILTWEQDIYPVLVVAFVSISFIIIHLLNSSILTTLSWLGMVLVLLDLAMPTLIKNLSAGAKNPSGKPSDKDSQRLDKICLDLAKAYAFLKTLCDQCCSLKTKKPKIYYPALLASLLVSAYLGNKLSNLFLTYLATLFVALYPGLDKRGLPQKAMELVLIKLGRQLPQQSAASGDRRPSGKRN